MAMGSISGSSMMKAVVPALISNDRCCVTQKLSGLETRTVMSKGSRKRAVIQAAKSGSVDQALTSTNSSPGPAQSHLALLERMTENSTASQGDEAMTIRDQLASQIEPAEASEVVVPLAKEVTKTPTLVAAELTTSQKRNIRRQNYLNKASERNDAPFFVAVAGLVLVPPILILAFAIATGYVEFFP